MRSLVFVGLIALVGLVGAPACDNNSSIYEAPGVQPQIVTVSGPAGGAVRCHPADTGGNCPLPITLTFRLPQGQFVTKAIVAFQGDGSDVGVDRHYAVAPTYGQGDTTDVSLTIDADIPTTLLRQNALFTYTIRLVTAAGAVSTESTLTVSVT